MEEKRKNAMSRREFARRAAIASASVAATASAVASLAPTQTLATAPSVASTSVGAPTASLAVSTPGIAAEVSAAPQTQQPGGPKLSPESQAEVDSRIQAIFSQYGGRFSDEQKADVRRLCAEAQPPLDRLRAYALENGDNPALYLKPLVEREKKPAAPQSAAASRPAAQSATSSRPASTGATSPSANTASANTAAPASKTLAGSAAPSSSSTPKAAAPSAAKAPPAAAKKP